MIRQAGRQVKKRLEQHGRDVRAVDAVPSQAVREPDASPKKTNKELIAIKMTRGTGSLATKMAAANPTNARVNNE
jgi:hypothetical protein